MNNLKVGTRLTMGFGFVCLLLVVTIAVGISKVATLNAGTTDIVGNTLPKIAMANTLLQKVDTISLALRNMLLSATGDDRKREVQVIMDTRKDVAAMMDRMNTAQTSPAGRALLNKIVVQRASYLAAQDKLMALIQDGDVDEAKA